jgi:predicted enzyme related to lactoylglutathione lyase
MTIRESNWPEGTPCWVDLGVPNVDQANIFYTDVFNWNIPPGSPEMGGYTVATLDGHNVAGLSPQQGPSDVPPAWTVYLASDDVDATAARIKGAGGQLIMEPMDVMDQGRMAMAVDTVGASFGLWQGQKHTGAELVNAAGAQTWNENFSRDYEAAKAFYNAVFGYEYEDVSSGDFKYAASKINGQYAGGIGQSTDIAPGWSTYFGAIDTDATLARVIGQGGSTLREPTDSPYGRVATVADDQGTVFSLISVAPAP